MRLAHLFWAMAIINLMVSSSLALTPPNAECLKSRKSLINSCTQQKYQRLTYIHLQNQRIEDVEASEAVISNSTFKNVTFERMSLRGAQFIDVKFIDCVFKDINFSGAKFVRVKFENAKLNSVSFRSAYFDDSKVSIDSNSSSVSFENCLSLTSRFNSPSSPCSN